MKCPFCGNEETFVKDSRTHNDGESIKRRRVCTNCDARFVTLEEVVRKEIYVIKKNNLKELFDKHKLYRSIRNSAGKRLSDDQIGNIVNKVSSILETIPEGEVKSIKIGEIVIKELEKVDIVSFVRFAAFYMNFEEISDFANFIKNINISNKNNE